MPSYPIAHFGRVAAQLSRPTSRRMRKAITAGPTTTTKAGAIVPLVLIKAHQPDDRPRQPKFGDVAIAVPPKAIVTERKSANLARMEVAIARHDDGPGRPLRMMVSTDIRPPVQRDFTGAKGTQTGDAGAMRANIAAQWNLVADRTVKAEAKGSQGRRITRKSAGKAQRSAVAATRTIAKSTARKGASR